MHSNQDPIIGGEPRTGSGGGDGNVPSNHARIEPHANNDPPRPQEEMPNDGNIGEVASDRMSLDEDYQPSSAAPDSMSFLSLSEAGTNARNSSVKLPPWKGKLYEIGMRWSAHYTDYITKAKKLPSGCSEEQRVSYLLDSLHPSVRRNVESVYESRSLTVEAIRTYCQQVHEDHGLVNVRDWSEDLASLVQGEATIEEYLERIDDKLIQFKQSADYSPKSIQKMQNMAADALVYRSAPEWTKKLKEKKEQWDRGVKPAMADLMPWRDHRWINFRSQMTIWLGDPSYRKRPIGPKLKRPAKGNRENPKACRFGTDCRRRLRGECPFDHSTSGQPARNETKRRSRSPPRDRKPPSYRTPHPRR